MAQKDINVKLITWISLLCILIASIFSVGYHHFDEHFQIIEFAGTKLGFNEPANLPWEYHYQMRPSLQPTMVVFIHKALNIIGVTSPFTISFVLRLISGLLCFFTLKALFKVLKFEYNNLKGFNWFTLFLFLQWFSIYVGVRFSSENWSGLLFIWSIVYILKKNGNRTTNLFLTGVLIGTSFLFRFQSGFLAAGMLAWLLFINKEKLKHLSTFVIGSLTVITIGVLIDRWFYGEWTITAWNYIDQNLLQDKVSGFGVQPWWWYFESIIVKGIPPYSLITLIAFGLVLILKPKHFMVWTILPFLLVHCLIGHKETRFLFPLIYLLPIIFVLGINAVRDKWDLDLFKKKWWRITIKLTFIVNLIFIPIAMFRPADSNISLYKTIYDNYEEPITLYFINENPYLRVLDIHFYKRKNLTISKVDSLSQIPDADTKSLVIFNNHNHPKKVKENFAKVYSTFPEWMLMFNINNWQSRAQGWHLYEVHPY